VLERGRQGMNAAVRMQNIEAGTSEEPRPQSIASLLEEIVNEKKVLVRDRSKVRISLEIDRDAHGLFARVEPQKFKTVLSNLINNAIEALPGAGTVRVHLEGKDHQVGIRICDNGRGIQPEVLSALNKSGGSFGK